MKKLSTLFQNAAQQCFPFGKNGITGQLTIIVGTLHACFYDHHITIVFLAYFLDVGYAQRVST